MSRRSVLGLALALAGVAASALTFAAGGQSALCRTLAFAWLEPLAPGCEGLDAAHTSLAAGRAALAAHDPHNALEHFRTATAQAPRLADAHQARGEAAEALGEFDEALDAYVAAARVSDSARTNLSLGVIAERMGRVDQAVTALERVKFSWLADATHGAKAGVVRGGLCTAAHWSNVSVLVRECLPGAVTAGRAASAASREMVPAHAFTVLVEAGQHERALDLARRRGWVRESTAYCTASDLPISAEAAGLLAMLLQQDRADCLLGLGMQAAEDGLPRLARLMLLDRIQHSPSALVRERAAAFLRHRLPAHEVVKAAESLNVTGWRLQHRFRRPMEALAAYQKAIALDPEFSWPYHNIGRIFMAQTDNAQALVWLEKAVAVNPNHWRAQFNLGVAAYRLQRYDVALAAYQRAVALNPGDPDGWANVGWVLLALGQETGAVEALQTAVRLDPRLERERNYLNTRFGRDARHSATPSGQQWLH